VLTKKKKKIQRQTDLTFKKKKPHHFFLTNINFLELKQENNEAARDQH
jgi:hypothetical protein